MQDLGTKRKEQIIAKDRGEGDSKSKKAAGLQGVEKHFSMATGDKKEAGANGHSEGIPICLFSL